MSIDSSDQQRINHENNVKKNPSDAESIHYLAMWHLERNSFLQARKYFGHFTTLRPLDADAWICLSTCCAFAEEFDQCVSSLKRAASLLDQREEDIRIKFCYGLMYEKKRDFKFALESYNFCYELCTNTINQSTFRRNEIVEHLQSLPQDSGWQEMYADTTKRINFVKDLRNEIYFRRAVLKKEMGALGQSMDICKEIIGSQGYNSTIKANAFCLKGLIAEMNGDYQASEIAYRSSLQLLSGHAIALERLGRVYLRYRETIPAAVQCFFRSVETNSSNHVAWYLLGRCYMATSQYGDALEAYNRAINLNPNDPQIWCSLGVLYYAFGQYKESLGMLSRALKLDPNMADAWYNVGALYDMCNQQEDSLKAYEKAKESGLADRFAKAGVKLRDNNSNAVLTSSRSPSDNNSGNSVVMMDSGYQYGGNTVSSSSSNGVGNNGGVPMNINNSNNINQNQNLVHVSHSAGINNNGNSYGGLDAVHHNGYGHHTSNSSMSGSMTSNMNSLSGNNEMNMNLMSDNGNSVHMINNNMLSGLANNNNNPISYGYQSHSSHGSTSATSNRIYNDDMSSNFTRDYYADVGLTSLPVHYYDHSSNNDHSSTSQPSNPNSSSTNMQQGSMIQASNSSYQRNDGHSSLFDEPFDE